jgi:hypothetical protein
MIPNRVLMLLEPIPHLLLTALFALMIALIVALFGNRTRRERLRHAAWFFICSIAAVIGGSWLMHLVHG